MHACNCCTSDNWIFSHKYFMHANSDRDLVEIRWWDNILSVAGIFHGGYLLHAEGIPSLDIVQLLLGLVSVWWGQFTQVAALDPEENYARKYEAWRAEGRHILCLFSLWAMLRDCTENWIAFELRLCVIHTYFHLYDNTEIRDFRWGFPQSILLCFMCDFFLIFSYMCSIWSCSKSIKLPQVCL